MMPIQKVGMDWARSAPPITTLSNRELRLVAEIMPIGTATTITTSIAASASSTVFGKRSRINSITGVCWRTDIPKSPFNRRPMNSRYWM